MTAVADVLSETIADRLRHPTLTAMFLATCAARGGATAVRDSAGRTVLSYDGLRDRVARVAGGLRALGVARGDAVALMMVNRPEFFVVDLAALFLGAIPFSLYNSAAASQLRHVLADAGARTVVCDGAFASVLREARSPGAPPVNLVLVDGAAGGDATSLAELEGVVPPLDLERLASETRPSDLATLIYTSGSTGAPKGVEITHANLVAEVRAIDAAVPQVEDGSWISVLPSAHIGDRARAEYGAVVAFGHEVVTVADATSLFATVREVRPVYFGNPPRTWEKLRAVIEAEFGDDIAQRASADANLAATVRAAIGLDRVRWISTGSAPTQIDQFRFFASLGIVLCELWGMTETCSIATTNTPDSYRFGTVGRPLEGVEMRLADDGELLVRGPTVAARYRNRPDATTDALDADGWFRTGDFAEVDADGFWSITGRKKELIINAAGKNMSPSSIESALKQAGPVIMQACVVGDRRPYNVALIVAARPYADRTDAELREIVQAEVDAANLQLSRVEQIKRFALFRDEWLPGGDELTPTMKMKRREIAAKYSEAIDALYA